MKLVLCMLALLMGCSSHGDRTGDDRDHARAAAAADRAVAEAAVAAARANAEAAAAQAHAQAAAGDRARLEKLVDDNTNDLRAAADAVDAARDDAGRQTAAARLGKAKSEQATLQAQVQAAKQADDAARRMAGAHLEQRCLDNPLATGC
jgi:hypothetical protein